MPLALVGESHGYHRCSQKRKKKEAKKKEKMNAIVGLYREENCL